MSDVKINMAGVAVTNGSAKFHTCGPKTVAAPLLQLKLPMTTKPAEPLVGSFAFVLFKKPMTKLEAAKHLLTLDQFKGSVERACLEEMVTKRTPVPAPSKAEKASKKAATKEAANKALREAAGSSGSLESLGKGFAAKMKKRRR